MPHINLSYYVSLFSAYRLARRTDLPYRQNKTATPQYADASPASRHADELAPIPLNISVPISGKVPDMIARKNIMGALAEAARVVYVSVRYPERTQPNSTTANPKSASEMMDGHGDV